MVKQNLNYILSSKLFHIVFFLFFAFNGVYSQSSIQQFEHISVENGLSQGAVISIVQDDYGFLWFGTRDGLNRYDGFTFTVTKQFGKDSNAFSEQSISQLALGKENKLWIGTEYNGLSQLNITTGQLKTFHHGVLDSFSLSSNAVTSVLEDRDGTLWVGTADAGLNRGIQTEKGFSFFHYTRKSDYQSLSSNKINSLYQDFQGRLWISTGKGVCVYNKRNNAFQQFHLPENANTGEATAVLQLASGEILVSFFREGVFQLIIDSSLQRQFNKPTYSWKRITPLYLLDFAYSMIEDNQGSVWISTANNGLIQWYRSDNTFISSFPFDPTDRSLLFPNIRSLFIDRTGVLWMGTNGGGVFKHDLAKNVFLHLRHEEGNPYSLHYSSVRGMFEDDEKKIWIGGYGGLNMYNPVNHRVKHFFNPEKGASNNIYCITGNSVNKNILFLGTEGLGLRIFDMHKKTFDNSFLLPTQKKNDINFNVYNMLVDRNKLLWVATQKGIFRSLRSVQTYSFGKAFPIEQLRLDTLFDVKGIEACVTVVFEARDGTIWIGTKYHGFARWNTQNFTFEFIKNNPSNEKSLTVNSIKSILEDWQGNFWIGTDGGGVNHWKKEDRMLLRNNFERYTTEEGLPNNVAYGILEDTQHNIWISTNRGIVRITPGTKSFRTFSKHDGLQGSEFNTASYLKSSDNKMYFGGVNGVSVFNPEEILINFIAPQVAITGIKIHNNERLMSKKPFATDTVELEFRNNSFSFDFVALSYNAPEKNSYAYRMEGVDENWVQAGQRRYANYTHVNPGVYIFRVKAANHDGVWNNKGVRITIIIRPPFWLTWWFKTLIIVLLLFIIPSVIIRRIQMLKREKDAQLKITRTIIERQEQDRVRIARELHDSLGQEIIVLKNRAYLAKEALPHVHKVEEQLSTIEEIAKRAISSIQSIVHDLRPIHLDRIGLTETLIILLKRIKESTRLQISWQIENIDNQLQKDFEIIIFRCVQETFNNILKHSRATIATCEVSIESNILKIFIWDNGIGTPFQLNTRNISQEKIISFGFGIQNMIERTNFIGGSLNIRSEHGKGTNVIIEVPLNSKM